ncbi:MAG: hypothetical protein CVU11_08555 [Bacteroidetes bacterium HGW-Bacteroidetes-6]|jgi:hypothetical protein|nr:MAG: hypothetical protein CVU11_08555 [Bacteroidetes bacterium HGW-Bacteroidetes-6]
MKTMSVKKKTFGQKVKSRIAGLKGKPRNIATAFAMGSFIGVSPLVGMQIILSIILSFILKLNRPAAIIGVINTNWTKGLFLYPINYQIGAMILGSERQPDFSEILQGNIFRNLIEAGSDVFVAMLIGGCITGALIAVIYYQIVYIFLKKLKTSESNNQTTMKNTEEPKYALLTGASQGLGKALANELASRNINLLLVSLPDEGLEKLSQEISQQYNVEVRWFEADFSESNSVYEVAEWARNHKVFMLINNAGVGGTKSFESASPHYVDNIIQVNVRATSMLTRLMLPELKKNVDSYILNVASMASFSPFAFKTVYPASKAFVYSFSRGLQEELRGTGVYVSVIHPGPIKTNPEVTRRIEKQGVFGKMGLITTEKLAHIAIRQVFRRDSLILPGAFNKLNWLLMSIIPNYWKLLLVSRVVRREIVEEKKTPSNDIIVSHA